MYFQSVWYAEFLETNIYIIVESGVHRKKDKLKDTMQKLIIGIV